MSVVFANIEPFPVGNYHTDCRTGKSEYICITLTRHSSTGRIEYLSGTSGTNNIFCSLCLLEFKEANLKKKN